MPAPPCGSSNKSVRGFLLGEKRLHPSQHRCRSLHLEINETFPVSPRQYHSLSVERRQCLAFRLRHPQLHLSYRVLFHQVIDAVQEPINACSLRRRNVHLIRRVNQAVSLGSRAAGRPCSSRRSAACPAPRVRAGPLPPAPVARPPSDWWRRQHATAMWPAAPLPAWHETPTPAYVASAG